MSPERKNPTGCDELRADLLARGYVEISEFNGLKPGARVRNAGEQYPEAYRDGTANVLAVFQRDPSSWAVTYRRPDIEVIVRRDKSLFEDWSPDHRWADYGTQLVVNHAV